MHSFLGSTELETEQKAERHGVRTAPRKSPCSSTLRDRPLDGYYLFGGAKPLDASTQGWLAAAVLSLGLSDLLSLSARAHCQVYRHGHVRWFATAENDSRPFGIERKPFAKPSASACGVGCSVQWSMCVDSWSKR